MKTTSPRSIKPTHRQAPWIGPEGKVLSDAQLRLVSRSWDAKTWERYLSTIETPLSECLIPTKKLYALAEKSGNGLFICEGEAANALPSKKLEHALEQLTFKQRHVLELTFFRAKSSRQASMILGISQSTVRDLKRKALRNLKRLLGGGTLTFPLVRETMNQQEDSNV